jgi:Rieske Fe-S protein
MKLNRRQFMLLSAGLLAGCAIDRGATRETAPAAVGDGTIDAGPAEAYKEGGVYDRYRYQGFFLVRSGGTLFALSSICTHRNCQLNVAPDHSFTCPCHGSTFAPDGAVTRGPAQRNLEQFPVWTDEQGRVRVRVSKV